MGAPEDRLALARALPIAEIADRLGIAGLSRSATERVGPCPVCGGHDRFGINLKSDLWNCRKCGAGGDAIGLVQHVEGLGFPAALDWILGKAEADPAELARRAARARQDRARRDREAARFRDYAIAQARDIWARALPHPSRGGSAAITPVEDYLAGRGLRLPSWPPALRFIPDHPALKKIEGRLVELHRGPAMIAAVQDARGKIGAVHQTWIDPDRPGRKAAFFLPDGTPAPAKMVRGSKKGGAIRLTPAPGDGHMIMGEGIETTASVLASGGPPGAVYWAGVDLGNMAGRQTGRKNSGLPDLDDPAAFVPPEGITRLTLLRDGDSDPAATWAALAAGCRRAMALRPGLRAAIAQCGEGRDFNDILAGKAGK